MAGKRETRETGTVKMGRIGDRPYWVLVFSIFVRAIHQLGAAVFLGSFLLDKQIDLPLLYLVIVFASGVILMATEGLRHRQLFREVSGMATIAKLVVLGLAYHGGLPAVPAVLFAFVFASVCSHAPKAVRHRLLF